MAETESKALQAKEKTELTTPAEQTRPGLVFSPPVDIFETEKAITILADMPGVKPDGLNIDLRENTLTLDGEVRAPENPGEIQIFREYRSGRFFRQFTLSQLIDRDKIDAEMTDGVLRLQLPKVEAAIPRRIAVKGS
jgi:HSP20 family protein